MSECKSCNQHLAIERLDRKIAELERYASDLKEIVEAVAHHELDSQTIEKARFLLGGEALGGEDE